jgi:hypothetical protein
MRTPLAVALLSLVAGPAVAGSIEGRVQLVGPVPPPSDAVLADRAGGLRNAVVFLKNARFKGKPPPVENAKLDQKQCRFAPHVQALTVGTPLSVMNDDGVLHKVRAEKGLTVFEVATPAKGPKRPVTMSKPGLMKLQCDAGNTLVNGWIYVFDHPYYALSDEYGGFVINDLPPGTYTIEAWHEPADGKGAGVRSSAKIEVTDDAPAHILLSLKP